MGRGVQRRKAPAGTSGGSQAHAPPGESNAAAAEQLAAKGMSGGGSELPFLDRIQASFGAHDVSGAVAHQGPAAQDAAHETGARALTAGQHVAFDGAPSLFTAAHEAAHIAAQQSGVGPAAGVGAAGDSFEQHADAVAGAVVRGESAAPLLDQVAEPGRSSSQASAVQFEPDPERKQVSPKAMTRLGHAQRGIEETKQVLSFGAGNQAEALKATNFNSYFRMAAMRDPDCWIMHPSVSQIAGQYPDALTAAKADLAQGGNCGEHARLAFDWLRMNAPSEIVNRCDVTGLDHAFVIMGDVPSEPGSDLVVCDPWPTAPTACLWEDHFAYTPDKSQINTRNSVTGDSQDIKAVIAKGLRLSSKGEAMVKYSYDNARTEQELKKGQAGDHPWIWSHPNAASTVYDYHTAEDTPTADGQVSPEADDGESAESEAPADGSDPGYQDYLSWLRSWLG